MSRADVNLVPYRDFDYPLLTGGERVGVWPRGLSHFRVEEVPLYPFSGEGEHALLRVEKRDISTRDLSMAVASILGVPGAGVGYAGMKDKDAVAVQWFSVTACPSEKAQRAFEEAGARVLESTRHQNKLRLGHLAANRFTVNLVGGDETLAVEKLLLLAKSGAPNFYGPQRFGADGDNAQNALGLIKSGKIRRLGRWKRDLLLSALQSLLFNEILARRMEAGILFTALTGDVMKKEDSGGIFVCEDAAADQLRVDSFAISPTGAIFGRKMREPSGSVKETEEAVLADFCIGREVFAGEEGSRRELRAPVAFHHALKTPEGVELCFSCPPGVFATSIIREVAASGAARV